MTDTQALVERLRAMYSHRGDDIPTQQVNPDGWEAADEIERMAEVIAVLRAALEGIRDFGFRHPGHGHSCATLAQRALGGGE